MVHRWLRELQGLIKSAAHILYHIGVVTLSAGIALSLPFVASVLAQNVLDYWNRIKDEETVLIAIEITVALFLIPVTVIMHNFWALEGMQRISEFHSFLGNFALLGSALMFLAVPRPVVWMPRPGPHPARLAAWRAIRRKGSLTLTGPLVGPKHDGPCGL